MIFFEAVIQDFFYNSNNAIKKLTSNIFFYRFSFLPYLNNLSSNIKETRHTMMNLYSALNQQDPIHHFRASLNLILV